MYICYIYIYICIHMCLPMYIYIYLHLCVYMYMYIYTCIYICKYVYVNMCICMHMNTYIYTYKYVYPHIHIHMYTIAVSKPLSLFHAQDSTIHNATHTQTHPLYLSYTHTHNFFWRAGCVTCAHTHCLPPYMLPPHDSAIYMRTSHDARFDESRRTSE